MKQFLFLMLLLTFVSFCANSQTQTYPQKQSHTYTYTFENVVSQTQLDNLAEKIMNMKNVTGAKTICKWESGKGQVIFMVDEIITGTEERDDFDMTMVKQAIIEQQLSPIDFKVKE